MKKQAWRKINIQIPDDGTWERWIAYCKKNEVSLSHHGKQAGFELNKQLNKTMKGKYGKQCIVIQNG